MLEKTFSVRSNAVRNARGSLGKAAKQGVHFVINGEKGTYTWSRRIEGAPPVETSDATVAKADASNKAVNAADKKITAKSKKTKVKAKAARAKVTVKKSRGRKAGRKSLVSAGEVSGKRKQMFRAISSPKGASLQVLSRILGWQNHTVRGAVSTIGSQFGVKIKSFRDARRGRVYQVG